MKVQKTAAILVPLVEVQGEPALLYTKRSKYLTSHRGQVSFPGGKSDKEDEGPEQTALRIQMVTRCHSLTWLPF